MSSQPVQTNMAPAAGVQPAAQPAAAQPATQPAAPAQTYPTGMVTGIPGQPASWANNNPYLEPYWYNPRRLARYYHVINNLPPGVAPDPDVINAPAINQAYKYFESRNPGKSWMDWEPLPEGDPGRAMLEAIPTPGTALLWPDEKQYAAQNQAAQAAAYTPPAPEQIGNPDLMGLTQTQYDKLPVWQKFMIFTLSSPIGAAATGAVPGAMIGAGLGGPVGALVGGVAGAGLSLYAKNNPDSFAASALNGLDWARQQLEIGIGSAGQMYDSIVEPGRYGTLDELLSNMQAVNAASRLTYEVMPLDQIPFWDAANFMAKTENFLRGKGWTGAEQGQAWQIGNPDPVQVFDPQKNTSDLLVQFRREIMAGAAPEEVFQKYSALMGLSGMGREFMSGILLDPLNQVGEVEALVGTKLAKAAGNARLAQAFDSTKGLAQAMQRYGQILRSSDFDTLKNLNVIERTLAGVDANGMPTWLAKPDQQAQNIVQRWGSYLTGLTPSARASEVINNGVSTFGLLLERAQTPEEMVRLVKSVASTPAELARELSINAINSPDGAAIPLMLRDYKPETHLAIWEGTRANRELLTNIAEITGRTTEQVLADYAKGGVDLDVTLRQLVEKARGSTDDAAKAIVAAFDAKELTAASLGSMVKGFAKDGLPYTPEMFRAVLYKDLLTHGQKWAVDWFGVKPPATVVRLGQTIKAAQSMILLGLNPTYLINNAINNVVTMAAAGVFGMRSADDIVKLWERVGVQPTRLKAGVGISALGLDDWQVLAEATQQKGLLSDIARVFNEKTKKVQVFSNLSNQVESWSSMQAMTSGYLQAWKKLWRRVNGFDQMAPALEQALRAVDPNLPKVIYEAIEGGMNKTEIEKSLWTAVSRRSAMSYVEDVAKDLGMQVDDVHEMLSKTGVMDVLDRAIGDNPTDDTIRAAFDQVQTTIENHFDEMFRREVEDQAARAADRTRAEGYQAALDIYDSDQVDWMSEYMTASADWDAMSQDTMEMTPGQRGVYTRRQFQIEQRRWERYYKRAQASLVGIGRGLGLENSMARRLIDLGDQMAKLWQEFHAEKRRLQREFWDTNWRSQAERNVAWDELQRRLQANFTDAGIREDALNRATTDVFAEFAAGQYGAAAGDAARRWREATLGFRQEQRLALAAQFDRIKSMGRAERLAAWQDFQRGMMPQVLDQVRLNMRGAHDLYLAATGQSGGTPPEPGLRDLEVATRRPEPPPGSGPAGPAGPAPTGPNPPAPFPEGQGEAAPSGPVIDPEQTARVQELVDSGMGQRAAEAQAETEAQTRATMEGRPAEGGATAPVEPRVVPDTLLRPGVDAGDPVYKDRQKAYFVNRFDDAATRGNVVAEALSLTDAQYAEVKRSLPNEMARFVDNARTVKQAVLMGDRAGIPENLLADFDQIGADLYDELQSVAQGGVSVPDAKEMSEGAKVTRWKGGSPDWYPEIAGLTVYDAAGNRVTRQAAVAETLRQIQAGLTGKRTAMQTRLLEIIYDRLMKRDAFRRVLGEPWDYTPVYGVRVNDTVDLGQAWNEYMDLLGRAGEYHNNGALPDVVQQAFDWLEKRLLDEEERRNPGSARPTDEPTLVEPRPAEMQTAEPRPTPRAEQTVGQRAAMLEAEGKTAEAQVWQVRQAAQEYGFAVNYLADEWQERMDSTIVLRVNRELDTNYTSIEQVTPDDVRRARIATLAREEDMAKRPEPRLVEIPKEAGQPIVTRSESELPAGAEAIQEKARLERTLNEYERSMTETGTAARDVRGQMERALVDVYGLKPDEATAVMEITDARARVWARANGSTPGEWYRTHIDEVRLATDAEFEQARAERPAIGRAVRGGVTFGEDGRAVILSFNAPDVSTAVHEIGHIFRKDLSAEDLDTVVKWISNEYKIDLTIEDGRFKRTRGQETVIAHTLTGRLLRPATDARQAVFSDPIMFAEMGSEAWVEERFARAFEKYLENGRAPTPGLAGVFDKFKNWLRQIYRSMTGARLDFEISQEMRKMFDRLLSEDETGTPVTVGAPSPSGGGSDWFATDEGPKRILYQDGPVMRSTALPNYVAGEMMASSRGSLAEQPDLELRAARISERAYARIVKATGASREEILQIANAVIEAERADPTINHYTVAHEAYLKLDAPDRPVEGTLVQNADGRVEVQRTEADAQALSVGQPLGTVESGEGTPPVARILEEGYRTQVGPVLDGMRRKMLDPEQRQATGLAGKNLDPESTKAVRQYLHHVYGQMADAKLASIRWAENRRDAALLNYGARTGFDEMAGVIFPYSFWYTRSAIQWALRAMDRPAYIANWARLRKMQDEISQSPGFPQRLRGKIKIPVPFLPKWAGDGIYIDPLKQLFPFENLLQPFEKVVEQNAQNERTAEYILQSQVQNEEISAQDATEAIRSHSGAVWERALTQAKMETEQNIANPFDFLSLVSGPSLPIQWLYQGAIKGTPEKIGSLPITRQVRAVTALMGANQGRGYNLEGPMRRALGLPEVDEFSDYRVDRMLANMAAEGYPLDQIMQAMIDRSGPLFVEAEARAAKVQAVTTLGSFAGADLFPEGEQEQRQLKLEFDKAVAAKAKGDPKAITKFLDAYPEYEARMAQMRSDPEQRLRQFLIGSIWDGYQNQPDLYKKQLQEQLGQQFGERFMNKETRNYDAIATSTLAAWANVMGKPVPEKAGQPVDLGIELADPKIAAVYQQYKDQAKQLFPEINSLLNISYQLKGAEQTAFEKRFPVIGEYSKWKNAYLAEHPEIIPFAVGQDSKVGRASPEIQALYYQYQAMVDANYPDIYAMQDAYFKTPAGARKAFLVQYPQLSSYWDFRKNFMDQYPQVIPYLYSVEGLKNKVLGTGSGTSGGYSSNSYSSNSGGGGTTAAKGGASPTLSSYELRQYSPALVRQLYAYYLSGQDLGEGALRELRRLYDASGRPERGQDWGTYVDTVVRASFR